MLPKDFPPWQTVYDYFKRWCVVGIWEEALDAVNQKSRLKRKGVGKHLLKRIRYCAKIFILRMEVWHQCMRLIAAIVHYYNAYILNSLYVNSKDEEERRFLASLSTTAWVHVNLLGYYQFYKQSNIDWIENWL